MPPVVAYIATFLYGVAEAVAGIGLFTGITAIVVGAVVDVLATAIVLAPLYAYNRQQQLKANRAMSAMQNHTVTIKQAAASRNMVYGRARVGGVLVFAQTSGTNNDYLYIVVVHAGHECDGFEEYYLDNCKVTLDGSGNVTSAVDQNGASITKYNGKVVWKTHSGVAGQTVDTMLNTDLPSAWPATSTLSGICYSVLKLTYDQTSFTGGMPNVSVLLRGKKVYDPRSTLTVWSSNTALCVRDYLTDAVNGFGAGSGEIDDTACIAAANTCDELVALNAGGNENRYTCNGVVDTGTQAGSILADMAASMAGNVIYVSGLFIIRAGAYVTPTVTLTETDLRGPISIVTRDSIADLFNTVKGVYISSVNLWQTGDFPPVKNSGYITQDGGIYTREVQFPFTTSSATAQRLAKIMLERERLDITVTMPCKLTALNLRVGDTVMLTFARYGWTSQTFEVVNSALGVTQAQDGPLLGVDLTLRLTNANAWNLNSGIETPVNAALRSSLTLLVPAPVSFTATAGPSAIDLVWAKSPLANLDHYNLYRATTNVFPGGTPLWTGYVTGYHDAAVSVGTTYYYWLTTTNTLGVESSPTASVNAVPASATGPAGSNGQRTAILTVYQWAASIPATPTGTSTYTWATGSYTAPTVPGSWTLTAPAAVAGQTLWSCSIVVTNTNTGATDTGTWGGTTPMTAGYAGANGGAILGSVNSTGNATNGTTDATYATIGLSLTVTTDANAHIITFTGRLQNQSGGTRDIGLALYRDGVQIGYSYQTGNILTTAPTMNYSFQVSDTPGAGSHTYVVKMKSDTNGQVVGSQFCNLACQ